MRYEATEMLSAWIREGFREDPCAYAIEFSKTKPGWHKVPARMDLVRIFDESLGIFEKAWREVAEHPARAAYFVQDLDTIDFPAEHPQTVEVLRERLDRSEPKICLFERQEDFLAFDGKVVEASPFDMALVQEMCPDAPIPEAGVFLLVKEEVAWSGAVGYDARLFFSSADMIQDLLIGHAKYLPIKE